MFRRFAVLLLIATLVACPFRCGGAFGVACAAETVAEARSDSESCDCGCCRPERSASSESDSDSPPPEPCDCGSCVCEGALLDGQAPSPIVDDGAGIVLFETSPPVLVRVQASCSHDRWNDLDPSGRTLRVLRQSFQI